MGRLAFNLFVVLSLALTAAAAWLWPRSYSRAYGAFFFGGGAGTAVAATCPGGSLFAYGTVDFGTGRAATGRGFSDRAGVLDEQRDVLQAACTAGRGRWGFYAGYGRPGTPGVDGAWFVTLAVPLWFWIAAGVPLPAVAGVRRLNVLLRRRRGMCPACSYDLRASPGRCPECGWAATVAKMGAAHLPVDPPRAPDLEPGATVPVHGP